MNLDKVVSKQPCHGSGVAIVRGIQPDMVHNRNRGGSVTFAGFIDCLAQG
jgi:hypothetical protein